MIRKTNDFKKETETVATPKVNRPVLTLKARQEDGNYVRLTGLFPHTSMEENAPTGRFTGKLEDGTPIILFIDDTAALKSYIDASPVAVPKAALK